MAHFEIFAADVPAAKDFYAGLLGWSWTPMEGMEALEYVLASGDNLPNGFSVGLQKRPDTTPAAGGAIRGGTMTFDVADCDAQYDWALANGGSEALPPQSIPGIGRFAYVEDGQGNVVGFITSEEA